MLSILRRSEPREIRPLSFEIPTAEHRASNFAPGEKPSWELYSKCVHCGLCLDQCPTYRALGTEMDSPRGRIYQMLQVDEGRLELGESFVTHIDRCLGCPNCQTACPSGVQYGRLLESARAQIEQNYRRSWIQRKLREHFYGACCLRSEGCREPPTSALLSALGITQPGALDRLAEAARRFGARRAFAANRWRLFVHRPGQSFPAEGDRRGRVALLIGCIGSVAFAELNRATIRVLTKNGLEVCIPESELLRRAARSCGLAGFGAGAGARNIDAMLSPEFDAIVINAAGCGATMKEYAALLDHDPEYAERAGEFTAKVRDVTEYLAALGLREPKRKSLTA